MTAEAIAAALATGNLKLLIGMKEDLWFEAKTAAGYDLDTAHGRYELAKDVAAFANSDGGYLVIGLRTTRLVEESTDQVTQLDLQLQTALPESRYAGVIREYIRPTIVGLEVRWLGSAEAPAVGVMAIAIPRQEESRKYFLTGRVVEGTELVEQAVVGIFRRVNSGNDPLTMTQLYQLTQSGKSPMAERLSRIEARLDAAISDSRAVVDARTQLEQRIQRLR